jgi:hypothetical protein
MMALSWWSTTSAVVVEGGWDVSLAVGVSSRLEERRGR